MQRDHHQPTGPFDGSVNQPAHPILPRRSLLLAGAAGTLTLSLLSACTSEPAPNDPNAPAPIGTDDPDLDLRTGVVEAEMALIAAYDATIEAHPELRSRLAPFRANHAAHLTAVNTAGSISGAPVDTPNVPDSPRTALRRLAAAEAAAAAARKANCLVATRWQFSRELALIGGCEASHHALLTVES